MKDALAGGKKLPTELKKDAQRLGKELAFDEAQAGAHTVALPMHHLKLSTISYPIQNQHHISTTSTRKQASKIPR